MCLLVEAAEQPFTYSIPVTLAFEEATGKNVLLLPMGSSTDAAHSTNGMYGFC